MRVGQLHTCLASTVIALVIGSSLGQEIALAQPSSNPLSVDEVLRAVETAHPLLQSARLEADIAAAEVLQANGQFDLMWKSKAALVPIGYYEQLRVDTMLEKPTELWGSSVFAGYKAGIGDFASYDGRLQTLELGEIRAGAVVPLVRNRAIDRRRTNLQKADYASDVARLSISMVNIDLKRSAIARYWNWVAAGQRLALARRLLKIATDRQEGLGNQVTNGALADIDKTDNERAIAQRTSQVAVAERGLEQAALELSLLLRDAQGQPQVPDPSRLPAALPEPAAMLAGADTNDAIERRPEAKRLRLLGLQQSLEQRWAENQTLPTLDFQLLAARDFGAAIESRPDLSKTAVEVGLVLEIPLQTRFIRGRAKQAKALAHRFSLQERFASDRIRMEVLDAESAVRAAIARAVAAKKEVEAAMTLEAGEREKFANGYSTLLIVNIREQQTAEAQVRQVDALSDYQRALADLQAAKGTITP